MRTTFEIPEAVFKKAKLKAVDEGVSLKTGVLRALEREVGASGNSPLRAGGARIDCSASWTRPGTKRQSAG
jgi:hypothetical protein